MTALLYQYAEYSISWPTDYILELSLAFFLVSIVTIIGLWKIFSKADRPGWAALIPILNIYLLIEISGRPPWWIILLLVPFVNIFILAMIFMSTAESFGKSSRFGVGMLILPFIFMPVLGFGSAQYQGPVEGSQITDISNYG